MEPYPLAAGHQLGGYLIQRPLATGTFGTLYTAHAVQGGHVVVVKVLSDVGPLRVGRDLFSLGDAVLHLAHESLLPVYEVQCASHPPYVVMAHAAGGTLHTRMPLIQANRSQVVEIAERVGAALGYLHERSILHRGVQPASILLDGDGHALLAGFDLAVHAEQLGLVLPAMTRDYHAPEEEQGGASRQSDQYALGAVIAHLLTGFPPEDGLARGIARAVDAGTVPPELARVVLRAVAELPSARWGSVADFVRALREAHSHAG